MLYSCTHVAPMGVKGLIVPFGNHLTYFLYLHADDELNIHARRDERKHRAVYQHCEDVVYMA